MKTSQMPLNSAEKNKIYARNALLTALLLLLLSVSSLVFLLLPSKRAAGYTAYIYQDGVLVRSIPLQDVQEPWRFTLTNAEGGTNQIEVRPGSIGVISADCPDKICVNQGFLSDSGIPITCLPHRMVILLRPDDEEASTLPDGISY